MAVSHQWFLQWTSPSVYLSNINTEFKKVNPNWNVPHHNYYTNYVKPYELSSSGNREASRYESIYRKENRFKKEKQQINGK